MSRIRNKITSEQLNEIYSAIASRMDEVLPEFEFRLKGNRWVSTNTLHLSGLEGVHGKGKVTIAIDKTYVIGDFREGRKQLLKYLIDSQFHSQVSGFRSAVDYLIKFTGISLEYNTLNSVNKRVALPYKQSRRIEYIPIQLFRNSQTGYNRNVFAQYLLQLFGKEKADKLIQQFNIGSSKYWNNQGATVFWLIDQKDRVVGGQVILFEKDGKTKREITRNGREYRFNSWVHVALRSEYKNQRKPLPEWLKRYINHSPKYSCLFGLPQLKIETANKPIAIVESAKTAIIATGYLPQFIWMAVGSLSYLNKSRLSALQGRDIVLFPDAGGYKIWNKKAKEMLSFANVVTSDLLERNKVEQGKDLADFLIQFAPHDFQFQSSTSIIEAEIIINEHGYPAFWDEE